MCWSPPPPHLHPMPLRILFQSGNNKRKRPSTSGRGHRKQLSRGTLVGWPVWHTQAYTYSMEADAHHWSSGQGRGICLGTGIAAFPPLSAALLTVLRQSTADGLWTRLDKPQTQTCSAQTIWLYCCWLALDAKGAVQMFSHLPGEGESSLVLGVQLHNSSL